MRISANAAADTATAIRAKPVGALRCDKPLSAEKKMPDGVTCHCFRAIALADGPREFAPTLPIRYCSRVVRP